MKRLGRLSLQHRILLFFVVVTMLIIATFLLTLFLNWTVDRYVALKNISGQNAVRVYKAVYHARSVTEGKLDKRNELLREIRYFNRSFELLQSGGTYDLDGSEIRLFGPRDEVAKRIDEIGEEWRAMQSRLSRIANEPAPQKDTVKFYYATPTDLPPGFAEPEIVRKRERYLNPSMVEPLRYLDEHAESFYLQNEDLYTYYNNQLLETQDSLQYISLSVVIINIIALSVGYVFIIQTTIKPLKDIVEVTDVISTGEPAKKLQYTSQNEIGALMATVNSLVDSLEHISTFATRVGEGNFEYDFEVRSEKDRLGRALINMRDNLRQAAEDDRRRNWANGGMARFSEILRVSHEDIDTLAYRIVSNLVAYLEANQGALFLLHHDDRDEGLPSERPGKRNRSKPDGSSSYLEMSAAYAYDKRKHLRRHVPVGQGLLGQCVLERDTIHLTEIPDNYTVITSGLGESTPTTLLIVPLMVNDVVYGAIEIASFKQFADYEVEFVEKLSETIASTLSFVRANERTRRLLKESQMSAEQLRSQEEEMRQNMEELAATQEGMQRVQAELQEKEYNLNAVINNTEDQILAIGKDYRIRVFNQAFFERIRAVGVPVEVGMDVFLTVPPHKREYWKRFYDRALAGERFAVIDTYKISLARELYFQIVFNPIFNDETEKVEGLSVFIRDVTDLNPIRFHY